MRSRSPFSTAAPGLLTAVAALGILAVLPGCGSDETSGEQNSDTQQISALYGARENAAKAGDAQKACNWRITASGKKYEEKTYREQTQAEGVPDGFGGDSCEEWAKSAGIVFGIVEGEGSLPELCDVPGFWELVESELAAQGLKNQSCDEALGVIQTAAPGLQEEFAKQAQGVLGASLKSTLTNIEVDGSSATAEVLPKALKAPTQFFVKQDGEWVVTGPN